jgi:hypothetical protein
MRVDAPKIAQDVEMQRTRLYAFRSSFTEALEMPFARGKLDPP